MKFTSQSRIYFFSSGYHHCKNGILRLQVLTEVGDLSIMYLLDNDRNSGVCVVPYHLDLRFSPCLV